MENNKTKTRHSETSTTTIETSPESPQRRQYLNGALIYSLTILAAAMRGTQ